MIYFTKHALDKFKFLERHGFKVLRDQVIKTINSPEIIDLSRLPLLIAQRKFDSDHVLRVVYKKEKGVIKVITFYPGKVKRYEEK